MIYTLMPIIEYVLIVCELSLITGSGFTYFMIRVSFKGRLVVKLEGYVGGFTGFLGGIVVVGWEVGISQRRGIRRIVG